MNRLRDHHIRVRCRFTDSHPTWIESSLAERGLWIELSKLCMEEAREFLPLPYTAAYIARRISVKASDVSRTLRKVLDRPDPLVGRLHDGRLRVFGVRLWHGAALRWEDETADLALWQHENPDRADRRSDAALLAPEADRGGPEHRASGGGIASQRGPSGANTAHRGSTPVVKSTPASPTSTDVKKLEKTSPPSCRTEPKNGQRPDAPAPGTTPTTPLRAGHSPISILWDEITGMWCRATQVSKRLAPTTARGKETAKKALTLNPLDALTVARGVDRDEKALNKWICFAERLRGGFAPAEQDQAWVRERLRELEAREEGGLG